MRNKILLLIPILLLSASCSLFSKKVAGGVSKTVNGGADWQFSNKIKDSKTGTLGALSVSKMFFDPVNREVVYAGGYNGGFYKSEDSGTTWKLILSNILVHDALVNPADAKNIYVAGFYADHGRVLVTTDGGASWQQIFNEESMANPVRSIALNPANNREVLIGTNTGGFIKSSDGGQNWQIIHNFTDRINRIVWQGSGVYVLMKQKGLIKSIDGGITFQPLTVSLLPTGTQLFNQDNSGAVSAFFQMYISQVSPSLMYLTTNLGLYKSLDEGVTWSRIRLPVRGGSEETHAIAVSSTSANIVYTSVGATIYKSVDGAQTWQTQKIATIGVINYILIDPQLPQIAYAGVYTGQ